MLKYVSFNLTVPCVMWSPLAQIEAIPSQPFCPYFALQTSTLPKVAGQRRTPPVPPVTIVVFKTVDCVQSDEAIDKCAGQGPVVLSPSLSEKGLLVRAQW